MARRAARIERAGALTPRDRIWAAIRSLSETASDDIEAQFSAAEVAFLCQRKSENAVHVDTMLSYFDCLAAGGFLSVRDGDRPRGRKRRELALYTLVWDVGVEAPRLTADGKPVTQGIGREQMWASVKALGEFDSRELAAAASTSQHQVAEEEAKTYVGFLLKARYLVLRVPARPGGMNRAGIPARYAFVRSRNTGPRAPLVARDKSVMDQNTGEVVWPKP